MGELRWTAPEPIGAGEPTGPYVHWWLEFEAEAEIAARGEKHAPSMLWVAPDRGGMPRGRLLSLQPSDSSKGRRVEVPADQQHDWPGYLPRPSDCLVATKLGPPVANHAPAAGPAWPGATLAALPPGHAVLGVVDDGIAFANERFRRRDDPTRTRFDYLWLQGAPRGGRRSDLPFGRELSGPEIDALLADHSFGAGVDEASLYRAIGLNDRRSAEVQSLGARGSHGTAVADLAGGNRPGERFMDKVALMGVTLPARITQDTAGTFLELYVMLAIGRILDRVAALAARNRASYPVVINISYALTAGPMDGSAAIDRFIRHLAANPPPGVASLAFTVAAGNHRQDRTHGRLALPGRGRTPPLAWRVAPDDRTPSFVELWVEGPARRPSTGPVALELVPPGFAAAPPPPDVPFDHYVELMHGGRRLARVYHGWQDKPSGGQPPPRCARVVLAVPATAGEAGRETAPAGDWTIRLDNRGAPAQRVDLHVQRDDTPSGYRRQGRQSAFVDDAYREYDEAGWPVESDDGSGAITRQGTLNAFVSDAAVELVGAARGQGGTAMPYSGLGPTPARPNGPDLLVPSDESLVHR
ncbi:MAG TPA: hypothetical protein VD813_13385, partial [Pseudonocardia sp.]|nr:hypothetical protein [Pseudonocardia sp.]